MGNYTRLYQIQNDGLAGVAILAAEGPYHVLGSSQKVSAIWGWMIFAWAVKNSAMTFWGYEK